MSEATEALKTAAADKIAPQHYDTTLGTYQVTKGKNGAVNMNVIESTLPTGAATGAKQDTLIAATGAVADVEATGNGSVIGILKRVRTLVGDSLTTLGSAVGTRATLIAGTDGTNTRAIKTNASGEQLVSLSGSNVQEAGALWVKQAGRNVSRLTIFNAKAITTVGQQNSTRQSLVAYEAVALVALNSHDQAISIALSMTDDRGPGTSDTLKKSDGVTSMSITLPANGGFSPIAITSSDWPLLNLIDILELRAIATVAPTTGSLTVWALVRPH